jgi:carbon monoxide dehydrogenase subunit G
MELTDSFSLQVPADRLWAALTDVELIAPCIPGFTLQEADDPEYKGAMKIKVGAVTVDYDTTITYAERDDAARRAVLSVAGRERRGAGQVRAQVTAGLTEDEGTTTAKMVTDVDVTGRVAQFGRGLIADVSSRLTRQFVDNLTAKVFADDSSSSAADAGGPAAAPGPPKPESDAPLNLGAAAMMPVLKRVIPAAAILLLLAILVWQLL